MVGCVQRPPEPSAPTYDTSQNPELLSPDLYPNGAKSGREPEVRYGRYALVNTAPEAEQRDLMAQIIDVNIPANMHPSVQDAMQYVVDRSGYSLCSPATEHVNILFTRPLPAAQYKLGPMTLRNTLQVLAGPAWQVKVNEVTRGVCFTLRPGYQMPESPRPAGPTPPSPYYLASNPVSNAQPGVNALSVPGVTVSTPPATQPLGLQTPAASSSPAVIQPIKPSVPEQPRSAPAKDGSLTAGKPVAVAQASVAPTPQPVAASAVTTVVGVPAASQPPARSSESVPAVVSWNASVGSTLRQSVEAWAKRADWHVIWEADDLDYPIDAPLHFTGSFTDAISKIFPLYDGARRSFAVDGNTEQHIVHVSERKKS